MSQVSLERLLGGAHHSYLGVRSCLLDEYTLVKGLG